MRGPYMGSGLHLVFGFISFFATLAVLAFLAFVIIRVIKKKGGWNRLHFDPPPAPPAPGPDALRILDDRLARGDISVEDYTARRNALLDAGYGGFASQPPPGAPPSA